MSVTAAITQPAPTDPSQNQDHPFHYQNTLPHLPDTARPIFRDYLLIPEDKIADHIYRVREKAWAILLYPCIEFFRFLDFGANLNPIYPDVVRRVRDGEIFLDLGCCFGQEITRKLVNDGAPSENIIGADSEGRFIELGYELFQDKETLKSQLYTASIFDDDFLAEWNGKVDIVYVGAFLHLFDFEKQLKIMAQLVKLLRKKPGSLVLGRNLGADRGGDFRLNSFDWNLFRHNHDIMEALWSQAPEGEWNVEAELIPYQSEAWVNKTRTQGWEGDVICCDQGLGVSRVFILSRGKSYLPRSSTFQSSSFLVRLIKDKPFV